jgi:hypothetical protein
MKKVHQRGERFEPDIIFYVPVPGVKNHPNMKEKNGKDETNPDPIDVKMSVVHSFLNFEIFQQTNSIFIQTMYQRIGTMCFPIN